MVLAIFGLGFVGFEVQVGAVFVVWYRGFRILGVWVQV